MRELESKTRVLCGLWYCYQEYSSIMIMDSGYKTFGFALLDRSGMSGI